jgi:hypothetical protein
MGETLKPGDQMLTEVAAGEESMITELKWEEEMNDRADIRCHVKGRYLMSDG